jgi:transposase InsO family protein
MFFFKWKNIVETQTRKRIKTFQLDNDGKYTSDHLFKVCQNEGIKWHFTVRNTPQQNGIEECMNHTLVEKFRFMLSHSRLSKAF